MLTLTRYAAGLAVAMTLHAAPLMAASLTEQFTSFWVLGDSLSDDGSNVARFTDTAVWNEAILDQFGDKASGNYAHAGATAGLNRVDVDDDFTVAVDPASSDYDPANPVRKITAPVTDLNGQVEDLLANDRQNFGSNPLVSLWIGGNDLARALTTEFDLRDSLDNIVRAVGTLAEQGVRSFALFEVPDLSLSPRFQALLAGTDEEKAALQQAASDAVVRFNAALRKIGAIYSERGLDVTLIDTFETSRMLAANPKAYGLEGLGPCVISSLDCDETVYFDSFHPTSFVHDLVREDFVAAFDDDAISAVPLPAAGWMLIAGLGGLGLMRRRAA